MLEFILHKERAVFPAKLCGFGSLCVCVAFFFNGNTHLCKPDFERGAI